MEHEQTATGKFDYQSVPYRLQAYCFVAKQILLVGAATWLIVAIVVYLIARVF